MLCEQLIPKIYSSYSLGSGPGPKGKNALKVFEQEHQLLQNQKAKNLVERQQLLANISEIEKSNSKLSGILYEQRIREIGGPSSFYYWFIFVFSIIISELFK